MCRLIEDQGLLAVSDQGDVISLALARDKLRETTEFLNEHGSYFWVTVEGRPYKCPLCKGRAGIEEGVKCKGCKNQGVIRSKGRQLRQKYPEVMEQRNAQDLIAKLSAALGLDPTSRVRLKGRADTKAPKTGFGSYLQSGQALRK